MKNLIRWVLTWCILCLCLYLHAQSGYRITYGYVNDNLRGKDKIQLIITDTFSYWNYLMRGKDPLPKSQEIYGFKPRAHASYHNKLSGLSWATVFYSYENNFMFFSHYPSRFWRNGNSTDIILNHLCKSAFSVNEKQDTALVYYTEELNLSGAPYGYYDDIPGIALEIFDQELHLHLRVEKIEKGNYKIVFPENIEIVSAEEKNRRVAEYLKKHPR